STSPVSPTLRGGVLIENRQKNSDGAAKSGAPSHPTLRGGVLIETFVSKVLDDATRSSHPPFGVGADWNFFKFFDPADPTGSHPSFGWVTLDSST
ncbi:hypothetical protein QM565_05120, partial [Geitlerinema splendidum]|nr:hypothetical protein [Geitlerinema splendidum]